MADELLKHLVVPSTTDSKYTYLNESSTASANTSFTISHRPASSFQLPASHIVTDSTSPQPSTNHALEQQQQFTDTERKMSNEMGPQSAAATQEDRYKTANSSPVIAPMDPSQGKTRPAPPNMIDVDLYLQQNQSLLEERSTKGKRGLDSAKSPQNPLHPSGQASAEPEGQGEVPEETKGTTHSAASIGVFMSECQKRALTPDWDIREDPSRPQRWIGTVKVAGQTVEAYDSQPTKKSLKALLAKRAIPVVEALERPGKRAKTEGQAESGGDINWVGKLLGKPVNLSITSALHDDHFPIAPQNQRDTQRSKERKH